jgi:nucleotide-binding universal stress UspA family protein
MPNNFYNILVPVDFSRASKLAIAKAIQLTNTFNGNMHLVHVVPSIALPLVERYTGNVLAYGKTVDMEYAGRRLKQLQNHYQNHICGDNKIEISVINGNIQNELKRYIHQYKMDLVIKGLSRFNFLRQILSTVSVSYLVHKTNTPVLTVHSSGLICHFKKIVLPLHNDIPMDRIRLAATLGRHFKSTIYVLSVKDHSKHHLHLLSQTLEVMQSLTAVPVRSIILEGKNLARVTLDFSKKINADLIMINYSRREFCLPGFWNSITHNLLPYKSHIPVLTLNED